MTQPNIPRLTPDSAIAYENDVTFVADTWHLSLPKYNSAGAESAYDTMHDLFVARIKSITSDEWVRDSSAYAGGAAIIARWLYAGAKAAKRDGYTKPELIQGLLTSASFNNLAQLTHEKNSAAGEIERNFGLKNSTYSHVDESLHRFNFDPQNGLAMKDYWLDRFNARERLVRQGSLAEEEAYPHLRPNTPPRIYCDGHALGLVAVTYEAMLDIATEDPDLFDATLGI